MFYCISRLSFTPSTDPDEDIKQLGILCNRLRQRFKIAVKIDKSGSISPPRIVIAHLNENQALLSKKIDQVIEFCEDSGFGRVESEDAILDFLP